MVQDGYSIPTVSIYIRQLRTLFNDAIDAGVIKRELYPFGRHRYQMPSGVRIKKAFQRMNNYLAEKFADAEGIALQMETSRKDALPERIRKQIMGESSESFFKYSEEYLTELET
jgi:hypothetical protein